MCMNHLRVFKVSPHSRWCLSARSHKYRICYTDLKSCLTLYRQEMAALGKFTCTNTLLLTACDIIVWQAVLPHTPDRTASFNH